MNRLIVIMDMNIGFAKAGALYSPQTEALIQPIAHFCEKMKRTGAKILALTDTHAPSDHEFTVFPPHCLSTGPNPSVGALAVADSSCGGRYISHPPARWPITVRF